MSNLLKYSGFGRTEILDGSVNRFGQKLRRFHGRVESIDDNCLFYRTLSRTPCFGLDMPAPRLQRNIYYPTNWAQMNVRATHSFQHVHSEENKP